MRDFVSLTNGRASARNSLENFLEVFGDRLAGSSYGKATLWISVARASCAWISRAGRLCHFRVNLTLKLLDFFGEHRHGFKKITHDAVIGDVEDGGFRIFVDGDDGLRVLHADQVL